MRLEVDCISESLGERNKYKLNLNFELNRDETKRLLENRSVSVSSNVEFKAVSDWSEIKDLTEDDGLDVNMKVELGDSEGELRVGFETLVDVLGGRGSEKLQRIKAFICRDSGVEFVYGGHWHKGKHVLASAMTAFGRTRLVNAGLKQVDFSVSLGGCELGRDGKTATCD